MVHARLALPILAGALALGGGACNGTLQDENGDNGTSGGSATGGASTTGGAAGTGVSGGSGLSGSAGSTSPTGGVGTGGGNGGGLGGASGTATASGGLAGAVTTGGANTTGGTGGASTTGGASATGGASTTGGAGGGGAGVGMGGAAPTNGCGAATWPPGDGTTLLTLDVAGTQRQYIVSIPTGYDPNHPYRLIFAWHGRTGTAAQIARNYYGLKTPLGSSTIFVSGQGLGINDPSDTGWANTNDQDIAFVRALITSLEGSYCVDKNRVMSVGMSYGGIMSYTIACEMGDVFRAIAPIAGAFFGGRGTQCVTNHVAVFAVHGTADDQVSFVNGTSAKDTYVTKNHCMTTELDLMPTACPASPTDACKCVTYAGCDAGYPVDWCTHNGGHTIPNWSGPGIATFFQQF